MDSHDSNSNSEEEFDCNICLDSVQEPVVTFCGHLYCWPCIYRWLHSQAISTDDNGQPQCPVCKAEVSLDALVPLFIKDQSSATSKSKNTNLGIVIPRRPLSLSRGFDSPRSPIATTATISPRPTSHFNHHPQSPPQFSQPASYVAIHGPGRTGSNLFDPVIGIIREIIYAREVGNSINNMYNYPNSYYFLGNNQRLRRHMMRADTYLSRICFFLFCCVFLCLLLF